MTLRIEAGPFKKVSWKNISVLQHCSSNEIYFFDILKIWSCWLLLVFADLLLYIGKYYIQNGLYIVFTWISTLHAIFVIYYTKQHIKYLEYNSLYSTTYSYIVWDTLCIINYKIYIKKNCGHFCF